MNQVSRFLNIIGTLYGSDEPGITLLKYCNVIGTLYSSDEPGITLLKYYNVIGTLYGSDEPGTTLLKYYNVIGTLHGSDEPGITLLKYYNVIGTLYGSDEPDQEVLVGAELRVDSQSLSNSSFISNVAALLNLAESMTFIRRAEGWRPRRTVKFALWTTLGEMSVGIAKYTQRRRFGLHDSTVAYIHLTDEHTGWVTAQSLNWKSSPGFADLVWHASDMVPNPLNKEFSLAEDWIQTRDPKVLANDRPLYTYSQNEAPLFQELGISCISLATQLDNMQDDVERGEVTPTLFKLEAQSRVASLVAVRFIDSPILPFNLTHFIQHWSTVIKSTLLAISSSLDPGGSIAKKIERIHSVLDTIVTFSIKDGVHQPSCSTIHSKNNMYKNLESVFERVHDGEFSYGQTGLQVLMKNAIEEFIFTHDQNPVNVMLDTVLECLSRTSEIIESLRFS
ncbi:hypothetical protein DPMN_140993 [Dreissena polymorpha]|uniref:Uncharacterized protein n=1 Tax=Dreissena polymorpha TaxID=45954 RepID=A0A9D4G8S9_DREPO|nr:hypothetical protein DPMN_140993 [Dreissena polymorpha]